MVKLGSGFITRFHIRSWVGVRDADVRGVWSPTAARAEEAAGLALAGLPGLRAADACKGAPHADKLGWRVACCAYTFNQFPFAEAVKKTAALGLKCIEGFAWQPLSKEKAAVQTNEAMPAAVRGNIPNAAGIRGPDPPRPYHGFSRPRHPRY